MVADDATAVVHADPGAQHCRLLESPVAAEPLHAEEATSLLLDLTERLLDAHAAALAAVAGARSDVRAQVQSDYEAQRQELLQAALGEAVRLRTSGERTASVEQLGQRRCVKVEKQSGVLWGHHALSGTASCIGQAACKPTCQNTCGSRVRPDSTGIARWLTALCTLERKV